MAYLIGEELDSLIREFKIKHISDGNPENVAIAISTAISEVRSRLTSKNDRSLQDGRMKYDTEAIFSAEGNDRHPLILNLTKVVAIWWLIPRNNAGIDYEVIRDRYSAAVEFLKDLAAGEANDPTLPVIEDPIDEEGNPISSAKPFRMGSRKKFNHE
ncbi:hypothetical protein [Sphingobacterium hotanense]|uniref:DUF1320 family protein n=1 Tax=Sphingobacterium hotanense TaxID=649196 RepID=A0ABT7NLN3_9SPHI|nr:hypothetical protein [Sphingobacterium hotanense]MDM1048050.1 DUF1320 family protein [Sphingobacterium hotanense]